MKDENKLSQWVKTVVTAEDHKKLKKLAIDKDISLTKLMRKALKIYLKK